MTRRYAEIDALKAAGIVAVILIHSMRAELAPSISPLEVWLGHVTRFGVPAFLFASGVLYATRSRVRAGTTGRRLRRILVPYTMASLLAQGWHHGVGLPTTTGSPVTDLLLGASFAPYYYVLEITVLVLVTPLFGRLGGGALAGLAVLLPAQWFFAAAVAPDAVHPFWQIRNPLLWWGYFAAGWVVREHHAAIVAWIAPRSRAFVATSGAIVAALAIASGADGPQIAVRSAAWLNVYAILATLFAATCNRSHSPAPVRYLSDATYAIYLLHLFFVYSVARHLHMEPGRADLVVMGTLSGAGLLGSLAVVAVTRRLLGPRSRDLIGA